MSRVLIWESDEKFTKALRLYFRGTPYEFEFVSERAGMEQLRDGAEPFD